MPHRWARGGTSSHRWGDPQVYFRARQIKRREWYFFHRFLGGAFGALLGQSSGAGAPGHPSRFRNGPPRSEPANRWRRLLVSWPGVAKANRRRASPSDPFYGRRDVFSRKSGPKRRARATAAPKGGLTVDWTQIVVTAITTAGTVLSGYFAAIARSHSREADAYSRIASTSADRAVEASMRPAGVVFTDPPPSG